LPDSLPYDEKELLLRIADGDEKAFTILYKKYARLLIPFLNRLTRNSGVAEDIIQQALLSAWLHRSELPTLDNFKQWIFRVASNKASTWMMKAANIRKQEKTSLEMGAGEHLETMYQIDFDEVQKKIDKAVGQLSPQRRKIFRLYSDFAMSYNDIAVKLGISASTVRTSVSIALEQVRSSLGETYFTFFVIFFGISRQTGYLLSLFI
jgi:RNA polymerase sigma factor (sigma-70 family)